MKEIITELGQMLIDMLPVIIIAALFFGMLKAGGVINEAVLTCLKGLTG